MRRIIVTGDDFGYSREVNRAIVETYDRGILTHASLMVSGDAAAEAIALARSRPGLSVGLHLVVADGRATLPASQIPRLVDETGRFRAGLVRQGLRYQFSRGARSELAREVRAQLERFEGTGLALSRVDGHHHMHLHPTVLGILLGLSDRFRIPAIRLPHEELSLALSLDRCAVASKVLSSLIYRLLRVSGQRRLAAAGIPVSERVYGLLATGRITEDYLLGLIPRIQSNDVELYCHPATALPGERFHGPPASGPEEFAALMSERVKDALQTSRFVLSTDTGSGPRETREMRRQRGPSRSARPGRLRA